MPPAGAATPKISLPEVAVPAIAEDQEGLPPIAAGPATTRSPSVAPSPVVAVTGTVPPGPSAAPRPGSLRPSPVLVVGKSSPPPAPAPAVSPVLPAEAPVGAAAFSPLEPPGAAAAPPTEPPPSGPALEVGEVSADSESIAALVSAEAERVAAAVTGRFAPTMPAAQLEAAAAIADAPLPLTRRSEPPGSRADAPQRRSDPAARRSEPGAARRRAAGEDLIGELFERMHELSFHVDLVSGADFLVRVLSELIPCEGTVVHAFDLAKHEFVVIRARGPKHREALLHRTSDADPVVHAIMRTRSLATNGSSPTRSGAFEKLGVEPRAVLAGAARQGGRYLGIIELANPQGDTPFHEGEANALEYVCEQFAEFVSQRPVVLDPDVVLGT
jgi:hypothetical protein